MADPPLWLSRVECETLAQSETRVENFVDQLQHKYKQELTGGEGPINVDNLFDTILHSSIVWNFNHSSSSSSSSHADMAVAPHAASSSSSSRGHHHLYAPPPSGHVTLHVTKNETVNQPHRKRRRRREGEGPLGYSSEREGKGGVIIRGGKDGGVGLSEEQTKNMLVSAQQDRSEDGQLQPRTNLTDNGTEALAGLGVDGGVPKDGTYAAHGSSAPDSYHGYLFHQGEHLEHHDLQIEIAHKCHYASLAVVSVLLIEVILKILCSGSHFVKRKIEVFDAVIILASFVVDLVFIKGLQAFPIDDSIFILAFLLPWRVIRVVNSLVVAVIDHEHVKLRLLYSRKKKLDKTVENLRNEVDELKGLLQDMRSFCVKEGLEAWKIDNLLGKFAPRRRKDSKFYTLVKLVMSTASVADDKDSVSSSSIENDIRAIANRDSVLNINDCTNSNENTITSLNFLSVPGSFDSRSASDVDSYRDNFSSHSPSPSPEPSPCHSPSGTFLRPPGPQTILQMDDTQSVKSEDLTSRPCTPNILLTAPSMEVALNNLTEVAETNFGGVITDNQGASGGKASLGVNGVDEGMLQAHKNLEFHSSPSNLFLSVPNSQAHAGRSGISDSHSLTDLQEVTESNTRRPSCLSLNADAKGRRRKCPRRVNFDLS